MGFEPTILSEHGPEPCASTNFATSAKFQRTRACAKLYQRTASFKTNEVVGIIILSAGWCSGSTSAFGAENPRFES